MMIFGFDEYWCEYESSSDFINSRKHAAEDAFDFQQAKIDNLRDLVAFDTKEMERLHSEKDELQGKIIAVLKYLNGCECSLDVDIDSIKELLK